jgi:hypothetical protein
LVIDEVVEYRRIVVGALERQELDVVSGRAQPRGGVIGLPGGAGCVVFAGDQGEVGVLVLPRGNVEEVLPHPLVLEVAAGDGHDHIGSGHVARARDMAPGGVDVLGQAYRQRGGRAQRPADEGHRLVEVATVVGRDAADEAVAALEVDRRVFDALLGAEVGAIGRGEDDDALAGEPGCELGHVLRGSAHPV